MNLISYLDKKFFYTESGLRLPKNTESVKLFHHVDLDGVFTAILAFKQLTKQGIDPNKIELYPVQYNSQKPDFWNVKKNQAAVVVDFGGIPQTDIESGATRMPDVWSDHHEKKDTFQSKGGMRHGSTRDPKRLGASDIHRSDSERFATLHASNLATGETIKAVSDIDSARFESLEDNINLPLTSSTLALVVSAMISTLGDDLIVGKGQKTKGVIEYLIRNGQPSLYNMYYIFEMVFFHIHICNTFFIL